MRCGLCVFSLIWLLALGAVSGRIYEDPVTLPSIGWDFIIVGGGAAGAVLANRLSENRNFQVLLLESGPSNHDVLNSSVPFLYWTLFPNTPYDWNFTTISLPGLNNRSIVYPRGHILGGSTSVNLMVYTRGSMDDYNRWADVTGDEGWSWCGLQKYFQKNERWTQPSDHHNTTGQYDPTFHSTTGMNYVSLPESLGPNSVDGRLIKATHELPDVLPFNLDMNSGKPLGLGWAQFTIAGGERSSSARTYLAPKFLARPNLHVLLNVRVTRVLRTSSGKHTSFRKVEYMTGYSESSTRLATLTASKEVILSAGAIGSPHILLHSGFGPGPGPFKANSSSSTSKIPQTHTLPSTPGSNLTDHVFVPIAWVVNSTNTLTMDNFTRDANLERQYLEMWERERRGPLTSIWADQVGWARIPGNNSVFSEGEADPSAGPNTPHVEFLLNNGLRPPVTTPAGNYFSIGVVLVTPTSRGSVTINSSNPLDPPLIDPGFLLTKFDISALRYAIRLAEKFLTAPALKDYIIAPYGTYRGNMTDSELDTYIRNGASTVYHPVSTCMMTRKGSRFGVVDPDLKVKGVEGLRVVDASVFPYIPSAHTQAAAYVVAERAADLIKEAWK